MKKAFVITDRNQVLIQRAEGDEFWLESDDQTWERGFGIASSWDIITEQEAKDYCKAQGDSEYFENLKSWFDEL